MDDCIIHHRNEEWVAEKVIIAGGRIFDEDYNNPNDPLWNSTSSVLIYSIHDDSWSSGEFTIVHLCNTRERKSIIFLIPWATHNLI